MALWTDLITPAELTGYARQALNDYEARRGTLAQFLPNREVSDIEVKFVAGGAGLVEEARYRAFDAEPEIGRARKRKRVTIELPALSQQGLISERDQLRLRNASDDVRRGILLDATEDAVKAIADRSERQRGTVLVSGKATIAQDNYDDEADYGRDSSMSVTAAKLWSAADAVPIDDVSTWVDLYQTTNGDAPGALLASTRVMRRLASSPAFATVLAGGGTRPASLEEVKAVLATYGIPDVVVYDRRTSGGRVVPDDRILLLPEPVATDDAQGTELGATFWGQTLSASESGYGLAESEQPGVVAGAYRNEGVPHIAHTFVDSISLPVLGNANLAFVAKVL